MNDFIKSHISLKFNIFCCPQVVHQDYQEAASAAGTETATGAEEEPHCLGRSTIISVIIINTFDIKA